MVIFPIAVNAPIIIFWHCRISAHATCAVCIFVSVCTAGAEWCQHQRNCLKGGDQRVPRPHWWKTKCSSRSLTHTPLLTRRRMSSRAEWTQMFLSWKLKMTDLSCYQSRLHHFPFTVVSAFSFSVFHSPLFFSVSSPRSTFSFERSFNIIS